MKKEKDEWNPIQMNEKSCPFIIIMSYNDRPRGGFFHVYWVQDWFLTGMKQIYTSDWDGYHTGWLV
jgi:hypothetical protein